MTTFDDIYGGSFFKAADLGSDTLKLTIESVELADLKQKDGDTQRKLILSFKGESRKLPLNKTNANAIAQAFGKEWQDDWIGKSVMLMTVPTSFGDGIRVSPVRPKAKKLLGDDMNDEIPAL